MKWDGGFVWSWARGARQRCSGRDFTNGARQEIVTFDRNGRTGTRLLRRRRDRPDDAPVACYCSALGSRRPVGERHAQLHFVLNLKKIFSPEQNSGARNVFDDPLVPDRFSNVAEVHGYLEGESDGTHGPRLSKACARFSVQDRNITAVRKLHMKFPPEMVHNDALADTNTARRNQHSRNGHEQSDD